MKLNTTMIDFELYYMNKTIVDGSRS